MLFLFRGHNGPAVRCIAGALLLVAGIAVHGEAILVGVGAVLLVWGAIGALSSAVAHHHRQVRNNGRMS
jgi:hypothetical protein